MNGGAWRDKIPMCYLSATPDEKLAAFPTRTKQRDEYLFEPSPTSHRPPIRRVVLRKGDPKCPATCTIPSPAEPAQVRDGPVASATSSAESAKATDESVAAAVKQSKLSNAVGVSRNSRDPTQPHTSFPRKRVSNNKYSLLSFWTRFRIQ